MPQSVRVDLKQETIHAILIHLYIFLCISYLFVAVARPTPISSSLKKCDKSSAYISAERPRVCVHFHMVWLAQLDKMREREPELVSRHYNLLS